MKTVCCACCGFRAVQPNRPESTSEWLNYVQRLRRKRTSIWCNLSGACQVCEQGAEPLHHSCIAHCLLHYAEIFCGCGAWQRLFRVLAVVAAISAAYRVSEKQALMLSTLKGSVSAVHASHSNCGNSRSPPLIRLRGKWPTSSKVFTKNSLRRLRPASQQTRSRKQSCQARSGEERLSGTTTLIWKHPGCKQQTCTKDVDASDFAILHAVCDSVPQTELYITKHFQCVVHIYDPPITACIPVI